MRSHPHPLTPDYISACRSARLERQIVHGDYYVGVSHLVRPFASSGSKRRVWPADKPFIKIHHTEPVDGATWVPRLDQLLDLIRDAGVLSVMFCYSPPNSYGTPEGWYCEPVGTQLSAGATRATSREEAALRLLLAIQEGKDI